MNGLLSPFLSWKLSEYMISFIIQEDTLFWHLFLNLPQFDKQTKCFYLLLWFCSVWYLVLLLLFVGFWEKVSCNLGRPQTYCRARAIVDHLFLQPLPPNVLGLQVYTTILNYHIIDLFLPLNWIYLNFILHRIMSHRLLDYRTFRC